MDHVRRNEELRRQAALAGWPVAKMELAIAAARAADEHGAPNRFFLVELRGMYQCPTPMRAGQVMRRDPTPMLLGGYVIRYQRPGHAAGTDQAAILVEPEAASVMSIDKAYAVLGAMPEDAEWTDGAIRTVFSAIFGRNPDDDELVDAVSLCYAAVPPEVVATWERDPVKP